MSCRALSRLLIQTLAQQDNNNVIFNSIKMFVPHNEEQFLHIIMRPLKDNVISDRGIYSILIYLEPLDSYLRETFRQLHSCACQTNQDRLIIILFN